MSIDSVKVSAYEQIGGSPNPANDNYLGQDLDLEVTGLFLISASIAIGRGRKVYAIAVDLAGNTSNPSAVKTFNVMNDPVKVSSPVAWTVGELNTLTIGECKQ